MPGQARAVSQVRASGANCPCGAARQADNALGSEGSLFIVRGGVGRHVEFFAPSSPLVTTPLLDGVEQVDFAYDDGGTWLRDLTLERLPALIRLTLVLPGDSRGQWPSIVGGADARGAQTMPLVWGGSWVSRCALSVVSDTARTVPESAIP